MLDKYIDMIVAGERPKANLASRPAKRAPLAR